MSVIALVPILVLVPIVAVDLWVYADAKAHSDRGTPVVAFIGRLAVDTPPVWSVGCLVLWIVFFPLYLIARGQAG